MVEQVLMGKQIHPNAAYRCSYPILLLVITFSICLAALPVCAEESPQQGNISQTVGPPSAPLPAGHDGRILDRLTWIGSLDAAYSRSHQESGASLSGGSVNGLFAPRYRISEDISFILRYSGSYYKRLDFYSDDVGPRQRTEFQSHTCEPTFRINFGDKSRYYIAPSFYYTKTLNKDVEGGSWNGGLYNYRDIGGGLDLGIRNFSLMGWGNGVLRAGLKYYNRQFPNFDSLLDLAIGNNLEKDEKDYNGILARIGYDLTSKTGFSWGVDYYLLYKRSEDKRVVDVPNGELSSEKQRDYMHSLNLRFRHTNTDMGNRLRLGLDLNCTLYDSNQNYYDGMGTGSPADDMTFNDFYDYTSYMISPNIAYALSLFPVTISARYSFQKTGYRDRKAQNSGGAYKDDNQYENQHVAGVTVRYELFESLSIYAQYQYVDVGSNNDYEGVYQYDHTVHTLYSGISLTF